MDGRIEHGFRARLLTLAVLEGREDASAWVDERVGEARRRAPEPGPAFARALAEAWESALASAKGACSRGARGGTVPPPWARFEPLRPPRFLCDPSLAGLARWLRAAGYEAFVSPEVPGHRLPDEALRRGLVLLTTEAETLDRRIAADGSLVLVWVPSALTMAEQLHMVALELGLAVREARCMACGGRLVPRPKEEVRPRIPPRTALWLDEYFVCSACDRLFWRGTHWERIEATLRRALAA